jgi:hypothetical protein
LVCFNCGDPGHFIGNCVKPKLCFICHGEHMSTTVVHGLFPIQWLLSMVVLLKG